MLTHKGGDRYEHKSIDCEEPLEASVLDGEARRGWELQGIAQNNSPGRPRLRYMLRRACNRVEHRCIGARP
jgi:hypothetical protein